MRIVEFEVEGFRSIKRLHLRDLGPFVVMYGPNGAGKSNVIAAVGKFWELLAAFGATPPRPQSKVRRRGDDGILEVPYFVREDVWRRDAPGRVIFRAVVDLEEVRLPVGVFMPARLEAEFEVSIPEGGRVSARALLVELGGEHPSGWRLKLAGHARNIEPAALAAVLPRLSNVARQGWLAISALRGLPEGPVHSDSPGGGPDRAAALALVGRFAEASFVAQTSPDLDLLDRARVLEGVLCGPPFYRPRSRAVREEDGTYEIQEVVQQGSVRLGVPLDLAGLGVQQIYAILGAIILSKAPVAAIEEPEAHLHAPTMGMNLRLVLRRMIDDGVISQLFIATHSTLFDLDETGYYDVRFDETEGTVVERRSDLVNIDRHHLYEPGPARHALMDALARVEGDRVVFWRAGGTPVTASQMVRLLVDDDPVTLDYLRSVTAAAVRAVALAPPDEA